MQSSLSAVWNFARSAAPASGCLKQHRIVGAHVPLDADAVEAVRYGVFQRRLGGLGRESRIGGDDAEHGCHVRADHAGPFAHSGQAHDGAADFQVAGGDFDVFVGRQDAAGRGEERGFIRSQFRGGGSGSGGDLIHRQEVADDAGGHDEGLGFCRTHGRGREASHFARVGHAAFARAGVGVARIHNDDADVGRGRALPVEYDRCGVDQVGRVNARGHSAGGAVHERQVFLLRVLLDSGMNAGEAEAEGKVDRHDLQG
jgi:hypothetical protein